MAILQALISYLGKSAGKALNAIFGWAVLALFGTTSAKEQTLLSAVVAAAAAWPILLLGVIVPKIALLIVAFVPMGKSVPSFWLRLIWIALAVLVPIVVGSVVAKRGSQDTMPEPGWKKFLRGVPVVVGQARALCTEVYGTRPIIQTFDAGARDLEWHAKRVWAIYLEQPDAHERSDVLEHRVTELSAQLSRLNLPWDEWQIIYRLLLQVDRAVHGDEPLLEHAQRVEERDMADEKALPAPRNIEKLPARRQGLQTTVPMSVEGMSNRELIGHVIENATQLAKKEIELAKSELRADVKKEVAMVKGLGVAGLCAIWAVSLMLVAIALALGNVIPEWAAALIVAGVVLAVGTVAGLVGWGKRVKKPLEATRRSLKEDALWAKERLA